MQIIIAGVCNEPIIRLPKCANPIVFSPHFALLKLLV